MSSTVHNTEDAFGTSGYRAPELLGPHPNFSKKVDIWGLGCVLYELVFHEPPFRSDYKTREYATGVKLCFPESNLLVNPTGRRYFIQLIEELLHLDASIRPSAGGLLRKLDELENTLTEPLDRHETEDSSQRVGISRNSQRFQECMCTFNFVPLTLSSNAYFKPGKSSKYRLEGYLPSSTSVYIGCYVDYNTGDHYWKNKSF